MACNFFHASVRPFGLPVRAPHFAWWREAIGAVLAIALGMTSVFAATPSSPKGPLTFEHDIRPLLKASCFQCHGEGEQLKGGLDLRLRRLIAKGGESGPALVAGKPEKSLLYQQVHLGEMPKGEKKFTKEQVALIGRWIAGGARTAREEPTEIGAGLQFTEEEKKFWSFQPIKHPAVPPARATDRVRTPVDAFLLANLKAKGLRFAADADKRTLLRRASFDLTGLPPSPEEADRFLNETAADAYEKLIDRLLSSPRYGERWGRHWLDVAGYADSDGYATEDTVRQHSYKYRDYVIRSLNADKPLDQFIQEQLAGDEMVKLPYKNLSPGDIEKLVATGFLRNAPDGTASGEVDQNLARNQVIAETIKIASTALLGLTVGCAQCHDHRYDPVPQADYYRLRAVFEPAYDWKNWRNPAGRLVSLYTAADRAKAALIETEAAKHDQERAQRVQELIEKTLEKELAKLPAEIREPIRAARKAEPAKRTPEQKQLLQEHPSVNVDSGSLYLYEPTAMDELKKFEDKAAAVRANKPSEDFIRALTEIPGTVPVTYLFNRGDHAQPKQALAPGGLSILATAQASELPSKDPALPTTGRRLAFARKLTDGTNPLTARVLVNRVWLHHFGQGIVGTPGDFGALGERPTHPDLLDWLASDFMAGGWQLKRLHKLIMTSTAYRQSSQRNPKLDKIDPDNRLYARVSVRRLDAEVIRDSILAVSGKLNPQLFGEPVPVTEDEVGQIVLGIEKKDGNGVLVNDLPLHGQEFRRSVYVQVRRSRPLAVLDTFDEPPMDPNCDLRRASTVTPQALILMNSRFAMEFASYFSQRVVREAGHDAPQQIARAWRLAFSKEPSAEELNRAQAFLAQQTEQFKANAPKPATPPTGKEAKPMDLRQLALANFCQALLSANEFLYVD